MSEDVLKDGREAERLATDPTLLKALQQIENDAVEAWKVAKDKDSRENCHATVRAINLLRSKFDAMKGNKAMFEATEKRFGRQPK